MTFSQRGMLLGNQIPDYAEAVWLSAPNAAGQSVTANTITALTLDTLVKNGFGASIGGNQVTLPAGTYAFRVSLTFKRTVANNPPDMFCRLYNVNDSSIIDVESGNDFSESANYSGKMGSFYGQFTLNATKTIQVEVVFSEAVTVGINGTTAFTLSTSGAQYRTKLQLWRLKETYSQTPIKIGAGNQWTSYAELRNLVAFNAIGQSITADTIATIQLTEKTTDPDGIVVLSGNQFNLGAGTYFMEFEGTPILTSSAGDYNLLSYWIKNVTDGTYAVLPAQGNGMQIASTTVNGSIPAGGNINGNGVVVISGSKTFELQFLADRGGTLGTMISQSLSTANSNCLARVKIYKR